MFYLKYTDFTQFGVNQEHIRSASDLILTSLEPAIITAIFDGQTLAAETIHVQTLPSAMIGGTEVVESKNWSSVLTTTLGTLQQSFVMAFGFIIANLVSSAPHSSNEERHPL